MLNQWRMTRVEQALLRMLLAFCLKKPIFNSFVAPESGALLASAPRPPNFIA